MAAKSTMLWFIDSADPIVDIGNGLINDPVQATSLAAQFLPDSTLVPTGDVTLDELTVSDDDEIFTGVYGRLAVLAGSGLATDAPSLLTGSTARLRPAAVAIYLNSEPSTALGVFARWEDGELRRSFAATPVTIFEDAGLPFVFEHSFWAGGHPLHYADGVPPDPQALPFHPQEFAEQAIREWLGFRFTRPLAETDIDPTDIPVTGFLVRPADYVAPPEGEQPHRRAVAAAATGVTGLRDDGDTQPQSGRTREKSATAGGSVDRPDSQPGKIARWFGFGGRHHTETTQGNGD